MIKGIILAASAALLWGTVPVASKIVLQEVSPILLAFIRLSVAAVFLLACQKMVVGTFKRPTKEEWILFGIGGGIGIAGNYVFYHLGLDLTTAISAQLVVQSETIFLVLASIIFLDERIGRAKLIAIMTAFLGVLIVIWNGHDLHALLGMRSLFGDFLVVLAALSWTIFALMQKLLHKRYDAYHLVTYMFTIGSIVLAPLALPWMHQLLLAGPQVLLLLLYLSVIGTGLSYLLFSSSMKHASVSTVAAVILIGPLATMVLAKIFLAEPITAYALFGGALLISSLYFVVR